MAAKTYAAGESALCVYNETLLNLTVLASVYGLMMLSWNLRWISGVDVMMVS
jgi:hypothetical protein